jgi:hypothetical protein
MYTIIVTLEKTHGQFCQLAALTLLLFFNLSCAQKQESQTDSVNVKQPGRDVLKHNGITQRNGTYYDRNGIALPYFAKGQRIATVGPYWADFEDSSNIQFMSLPEENADYVINNAVEFAKSMFELLPIGEDDSIIDASYTTTRNFSAVFSVYYNPQDVKEYLLQTPILYRIDLKNSYGNVFRLYWIDNSDKSRDKIEGIFALVPRQSEDEFDQGWLCYYREDGGPSNFKRNFTREKVMNENPHKVWEKLAATSNKEGFHYYLVLKGSESVTQRRSEYMSLGILQSN